MKRDDLKLSVPCGVDFRSMSKAERGRRCARCETLVYDLSSMTEAEARALITKRRDIPRLCVRYLYDANERVVFADGHRTEPPRIIPEFGLTARAKAKLAQAALLAAPLVLFEACGTMGFPTSTVEAGDDERVRAEAGIADSGEDAGDATDGAIANDADASSE